MHELSLAMWKDNSDPFRETAIPTVDRSDARMNRDTYLLEPPEPSAVVYREHCLQMRGSYDQGHEDGVHRYESIYQERSLCQGNGRGRLTSRR